MTYSMQEIQRAWDAYSNKQALRVLKNGKWEVTVLNGGPMPRVSDAVRAETVPLKQVQSFPTFLEETWKK
jgi:hypothetical protein